MPGRLLTFLERLVIVKAEDDETQRRGQLLGVLLLAIMLVDGVLVPANLENALRNLRQSLARERAVQQQVVESMADLLSAKA